MNQIQNMQNKMSDSGAGTKKEGSQSCDQAN